MDDQPLSPMNQFRYNKKVASKSIILLRRSLTGMLRAAIQLLMTAKDDTKQVMWFLLILLQTIILALSGWCLSYTVATGERVARLEAKIDILTGGGKASVARGENTLASLPIDISSKSVQ